ncbi:MAG: DUF1579 family protein [Phycisphaerales bacterium]
MLRTTLLATGVLALTIGVGAVSYHVGASGVATTSVAQPETPEHVQAQIEEQARLARPNEHHKKLAYMLGRWDAEMNFPATGQGPAHATMTADWAVGGRFVKFDFGGEGFFGLPFNGVGYTGFDNIKGKYVGVWMDSNSTGIYSHTGEFSPDAKTLTMVGEASSPQGPSKMKIVSTLQGDDRFTDTFYEIGPDGAWAESGTIVYTRVKNGADGG